MKLFASFLGFLWLASSALLPMLLKLETDKVICGYAAASAWFLFALTIHFLAQPKPQPRGSKES